MLPQRKEDGKGRTTKSSALVVVLQDIGEKQESILHLSMVLFSKKRRALLQLPAERTFHTLLHTRQRTSFCQVLVVSEVLRQERGCGRLSPFSCSQGALFPPAVALVVVVAVAP